MEYKVIKRNKVLIHTTFMNGENIVLCEKCQTQNATYCIDAIYKKCSE